MNCPNCGEEMKKIEWCRLYVAPANGTLTSLGDKNKWECNNCYGVFYLPEV